MLRRSDLPAASSLDSAGSYSPFSSVGRHPDAFSSLLFPAPSSSQLNPEPFGSVAIRHLWFPEGDNGMS